MKCDVTIKLNAYNIIAGEVERALDAGLELAYKHTDNPSPDTIKGNMYNEIMQSLVEVIDFGSVDE